MSAFDHLPPEVRELAALSHDIAPKFGLSPWLILGIAYAESNFGKALKPPGPTGSGDFIPRPCNPARDLFLDKHPLPGVVKKTLADGIPARKLAGPVAAWCPTTHGWGVGVFQIDYEAHRDFIEKGTWRELPACMKYACELLVSGRKYLAKACGIRGDELDDAMIASYNAGAGRIAKFIREEKDIDKATFHPGYVAKIKKKADELAGMSAAWRTPEQKAQPNV